MVLCNKPVTSKKEFGKLDSFLHIQYFRLINVEQIFTLFWFLLQVWPSLGNKTIRKSVLVINNLFSIKKFCSQPNVILNNGKLKNYCLHEKKCNDTGLFDIINSLYSNKFKIDELDNLLHSDSSLIYMLLHENLIDEINRRKISDEQLIKLLSDIIDDSCEGDIIQGFIYKSNNWEMLNLLYIVQMLRLNQKMNDYEVKNKEIKYKFTQMLTKYSLKCNYNKKKINLLENNKISNNYFDVVVQNVLHLLKNQDTNNDKIISKILEDNNIVKDNVDVLTKYNKVLEIIDIKNLNKIKKKLN